MDCTVVPVAVVSATVDLDVLARVGLALADQNRRRILVALIDGPAYPSDLADQLGSTRANVSNHLTCLRGCGLVVAQPEGRRVRYELVDRRLGRALRDLLGLVLVPDPTACPAVGRRRVLLMDAGPTRVIGRSCDDACCSSGGTPPQSLDAPTSSCSRAAFGCSWPPPSRYNVIEAVIAISAGADRRLDGAHRVRPRLGDRGQFRGDRRLAVLRR